MNTYELEIYKIKHLYYREIIKAKSRAEAERMLQERLDTGNLEFIEDDEEIADAKAYKLVAI